MKKGNESGRPENRDEINAKPTKQTTMSAKMDEVEPSEAQIETVSVSVEEVLNCWIDRVYRKQLSGDSYVIKIPTDGIEVEGTPHVETAGRYPHSPSPIHINPRRFFDCSSPPNKGTLRTQGDDEYVEAGIDMWKPVARNSLRDEIEENNRDELNNVEIEWIEDNED